jgi:hypothetical protein
MLAMAVLLETAADLQGANPRRRKEARAAVAEWALDVWIDALALSASHRQRMVALLRALAD